MHIRQIDNSPSGTKIFVSHGAYVLSFTAPMDREMHIKIIDAIKETITKKEIMIEESGLLDLSVRTVMRGRNCTYCNKEINRGENYIRRASFRRELNICRECAEKELQTICSELAKQTDTKCKVVMQRW
jgi:hypothetical protein